MSIGLILIFATLGSIIVGTGVGMLASRNAIYAALFLALNFATVALLYLILGAPFIALAQVTVYAGAIMVLFLFVIMLLGSEKMPGGEHLKGQRALAFLLAAAFLMEIGLYMIYRGGSLTPLPEAVSSAGNPASLGIMLFNQYLLPFEITSVILLAALVGAIILTKQDRSAGK